jgi:hypothetical protein
MARKTTASSKDATAAPGRRGKRAADAEGVVLAVVLDEAAMPEAEGASSLAIEPVLIEMDTFLSCGAVSDRFDIALRGRVISVDAVEELRLQIDGQVIASASYGLPERAMVGMFPDGTPGRYRGFQFNLPRPGPAAATCRFDLVARTAGGTEQTETYELDYDGISGRVAVLSGQSVPGAGGGSVRPHCIAYVERATLDPEGVLTINGWAVAMGPVLALQVFVDEERIGKARYGSERDDVAAVHHSFPNANLSGFVFTTTLPPANRDAAYARCRWSARMGSARTNRRRSSVSNVAPLCRPQPPPLRPGNCGATSQCRPSPCCGKGPAMP